MEYSVQPSMLRGIVQLDETERGGSETISRMGKERALTHIKGYRHTTGSEQRAKMRPSLVEEKSVTLCRLLAQPTYKDDVTNKAQRVDVWVGG